MLLSEGTVAYEYVKNVVLVVLTNGEVFYETSDHVLSDFATTLVLPKLSDRAIYSFPTCTKS